MDCPPKNDIDAVFNRLRAQPFNKVCFDCNAKNPTWASVTYGIFICIDCSAVHRSLGVHLTFVRSTNLDTNWNWLQIRQMQVGGNASASSFFRQHNCTTTDAQQKYNSRAAQLYKDKLLTSAQNACKMYGTTLHINEHQQQTDEVKEKETDFFDDCESFGNATTTNNASDDWSKNIDLPSKSAVPVVSSGSSLLDDGAEPNVDFLNSSIPAGDAPKSTIGVRKIQSRKPGMGARKPGGLGATKVKANFDEIEQKATMVDQMKVAPVIEKKLTADEEAEAITSVRLAYQDLSIQRQKAEDKLKGMDPNKAKQMERLGMGFGNRSSAVSHSMLSDMKVIDQDQAPMNMKSSAYKNDNNNSSKSDFFDDYSSNSMYSNSSNSNSKTDFRDAMMMGFEPIESKQNITTMFSSTNEEKKSSVADRQPTSSSSFGRNNREKESKITSPTNSYDSDSIQKKFSGAKGISSDQFFGNDSSAFERNNSNVSKFQGSTSISSDQYFGNDSQSSQRRGARLDFHTPDMDLDDIKDSVRTGVHKVAGKLSSIANNVNSFIQDKYGH